MVTSIYCSLEYGPETLILQILLLKKVIMKILFATAICLAAALSTMSQTAQHPVAHKSTTSATTPLLKTAQDSLSYAIGFSLATFYARQNITDINTAIVMHAVTDVKNNKPLLNEMQCNSVINAYIMRAKEQKAAGNKRIGQEFLAANGKKPGIVTLPSGLQYQVIKEGAGPKPAVTDMVRVHYHGTLINGKVFDSSIERGQPVELAVNGVIPGWTEALQLMSVGSKWKLFIPSNLAYGDESPAETIPAGSTLVFDVELLEIVKKAAGAAPGMNAPDSTVKPN
jgi:FKBP-type peptidyl-prolyl cis-trans isomerase FklB